MPSLPARVATLFLAVRQRKGVRTALLSALVATATAIALRIVNALTDGFLLDRVWPPLYATLVLLATAPIGLVLLLVLLFLAVVLSVAFALSWWETSSYAAVRAPKLAPPSVPTPEPPPPLSPADSESIQAARVLWKEFGYSAATHAAWTLEEIRNDLNNRTPLGWLLVHPSQALRREIELTGSVVHDYSQQPLAAVIHRFEQLFIAYIQTCRWIQACHEYHNIQLTDGPHAERYARWQSFHTHFTRDLRKLSLRSDYSALAACFRDGQDAERFDRQPAREL